MAKTKQKSKLIMILFIIFVALFLVAIITKFVRFEIILPQKTYHSRIHDYTIKYTGKFKLEENIDTVYLITKNKKDKIIISGIGTNMDRLDDYLDGVTSYNHLKLDNKENLTLNGLSAIKVDINGKRSYLIYKNNWVYSLETDSPELYDDLDRIAESFRYEP